MMNTLIRRLLPGLILYLILLPVVSSADTFIDRYPQARDWFAAATRFGEPQGEPPAVPVYQNEQLIGYLLLTSEVVSIPAYSGKPVNTLVGIDTQGTIVGAEVIDHSEPILLVGIPEQALSNFVGQYTGKSLNERIRVGANIDAITGATVTVMVINEAILRAARRVLATRTKAEVTQTPSPRLKTEFYQPSDWQTLTGNGAIGHLPLTDGEVEQAFQGIAAAGDPDPATADNPFIDLYYGYLNLPVIGRNLLGDDQYRWLMGELDDGEHAIAVLANGRYSFKGSGYVRGGIFDRLQIQQNRQTISFRDLDYHRLSDVFADGIPSFREMAIFIIRQSAAFDPAQAWQIELLVRRQIGALDSVFVNFEGDYRLPDDYLDLPPAPTPTAAPTADPVMTEPVPEPIWIGVWQSRVVPITVLVSGLLLLTLILIFQDLLVKRPRLLGTLRSGVLLYTVLFIGWYALAQLSVVNVLTFTNALFHDFKWDTFLIDPMMFILWGFVAMTLLLWGRGVYCGWLCPFGAIQELVNQLSCWFRVRQLELPFGVHERLWALKYLILIGLFGLSLQSLAEAEKAAEIEPFKTAITLHFQREWGYVLYAAGLILVSVVNRKFYCRYLCPLGAALAIPARIRLFDWLKRHNDCGHPCQICAHDCEVRAIDPNGRINANECHYCLDCQVTYFNDHKCPPMVARRKRRERAVTARQSVRRLEQSLNTAAGLDGIEVRLEPKSDTPPTRSHHDRSILR